MYLVNDQPAISQRRSIVPGPHRDGDRLTGRRVVTIGGGSRRLMDEFRRQVPLGDLRQSLVALARNGALWREVFMHRFEQSDDVDGAVEQRGVRGHSLGNLILKGLQDINNGDLLLAIEDAQELLNTAGRVLPVTLA